MKQVGSAVLLLLIVGTVILGLSSVFTVHETQKALVLQFGKLVKVHDESGLKFKLPFVQSVVFYDRRLQGYNLPQLEVTALDQKRIVVDIYARYVIQDPFLFYKRIGAGDPRLIEARLSAIVSAAMRTVLGRYPMTTLLSEKRAEIMKQIFAEVKNASKELGIDVEDVRIVRADLPQENSEAVYRRMESDRIRIAKRIRATGEEKSQKIRAEAEREKVVILAKARQIAQKLRGEGDAQAIKIYAAAFSKDPRFFEFYRSLQAYEKAMDGQNTTFVLAPEGKFFKYFEKGSQ